METWHRYAVWFGATFAGLLAVAALLIWIANPYGNLASSPLTHVLMDDNQRYQYPAVIRSNRYDSLVIGTSTARLLEPARLERHFGGRFANLALNSGTAWEQWQVARLFQRTVARPVNLIVGLDHIWCRADADRERITFRGFPEWLFDDNRWNDAAYMLNVRSVEIAGRRIGHAVGLVRERWPHNGYEVFTPPEERYDLGKAQGYIWGGRRRQIEPQVPPNAATAQEHKQLSFPALTWLDDILSARPAFQRVVFILTPVHIAAQPQPGSREAYEETECKARMTALAKRHAIPLVDFRIASAITTRDDHYWDALHYRQPIAARIVDGIAAAIRERRDDPDGDWRLLAP